MPIARRIAVVSSGCLAMSVAVSILLSQLFPSAGVFAGFGVLKRALLPCIYIVVLMAILWPTDKAWEVRRPPLWWWLLAGSLTVELGRAMVSNAALQTVAFAEDVLLVLGFLLQFHFASLAPSWDRRSANIMLFWICLSGVIATFAGFSMGIYAAVGPVGSFGLIYWGIRSPKWRHTKILLGATGVVTSLVSLWTDSNAAMAAVGALAACAFILMVSVAQRRFRRLMILVGVAAFLVFLYFDGTLELMMGAFKGVEDVTLAQRGYETRVVLDQLSGNGVEPVLGLGPGSTVDLSRSPDSDTLTSAGRDLRRVDDVHLITSWLLMKFGLLGFLWLFVILAFIGSALWNLGREPHLRSIEVVMVMSLVGGLVAALPAATILFSNPLMPTALGVLWSLQAPTSSRASHSAGLWGGPAGAASMARCAPE